MASTRTADALGAMDFEMIPKISNPIRPPHRGHGVSVLSPDFRRSELVSIWKSSVVAISWYISKKPERMCS